MPILHVEIVTDRDHPLEQGLAARFAEAASEILETGRGETRVRLTPVPAEDYAENGMAADACPRPVFVTILRYTLPARPELAGEARRMAAAFSAIADRPKEQVHLHFLPPGRGVVAFGGELAE